MSTCGGDAADVSGVLQRGVDCPILDPDQTRYVWHAQVDARTGDTTITANFQERDPNRETVEVSVRRACFFPSREHVDYITVRGFEMMQATGDWAPPTAKQWGMVGPNWAHGWVIEGCDLHDAKFSAVSLGACAAIGDNAWMRVNRKTGLAGLDGYPLNIDDYHARQQAMWDDPTQTGSERNPLQPAYAGGNVYTGGCRGVNVGAAAVGRPDCAGAAWGGIPADESSAPPVAADDPRRAHADPPFFGGTDAVGLAVGSSMPVWLSDDADSTGYVLDTDLLDVHAGRDGDVGVRQAGPLSGLVKGRSRIRVWAR